MATIQDIVTGAFRKLGVVSGNETPSATDSGYALDELNGMMQALDGAAMFINWQTVALSDTFPLDAKHEDGIKAMLAVQCSGGFGGDGLVSRELKMQARKGRNRLFGDYHKPEELRVDAGLEDMPSQHLHPAANIAGTN